MLEKKLAECRYAYEEELEFISAQFEEMQAEVLKLKNDKLDLRRRM